MLNAPFDFIDGLIATAAIWAAGAIVTALAYVATARTLHAGPDRESAMAVVAGLATIAGLFALVAVWSAVIFR